MLGSAHGELMPMQRVQGPRTRPHTVPVTTHEVTSQPVPLGSTLSTTPSECEPGAHLGGLQLFQALIRFSPVSLLVAYQIATGGRRIQASGMRIYWGHAWNQIATRRALVAAFRAYGQHRLDGGRQTGQVAAAAGPRPRRVDCRSGGAYGPGCRTGYEHTHVLRGC
jgi:hypothetical protein